MRAVIWSKDGCPFCDRAKQLFDGSGIKYEERNISTNDWTREQLLEAVPGARTVPQIFLDGMLIGGYQELCQYYEEHNMFLGNPRL